MSDLHPFMPWSPAYETGLPDIDAQHRGLVAILNRAARCIEEGRPWEVEGLFDDLRSFADHHFRDEERLLAGAGYPDLEAHRREHHGFRERLTGMYTAYLEQSGGSAEDLARFLRAWLKDHILSSDRAYVPHVLASR